MIVITLRRLLTGFALATAPLSGCGGSPAREEAPAPCADQTAQLAELRARVGRLEVAADARALATPSAPAQAEPNVRKHSPPPPQHVLTDANTPRFEAQLAAKVRSQPRDRLWEKELQGLSAELIQKGVRIVGLQCATDLCRIELDRTNGRRVSIGMISRTLGRTALHSLYIGHENLPAGSHDIMYIARDGGALSVE